LRASKRVKRTSHRHENQTSGIIVVAFDLYKIDGVCQIPSVFPETYIRVFLDIFVVITRENRESLLHVFPRAFDAKNARIHGRPFWLVRFRVDSTSHGERKKEKKIKRKKKHYPSHRSPWIRKIARYIDHIWRKKEEKEARRKRMILHTLLTRLRSEREEGCIVCANAYTGCADVNTRSDLRAINHDHVNHIYPSMDNWYYYLALGDIFLSSFSMRRAIFGGREREREREREISFFFNLHYSI